MNKICVFCGSAKGLDPSYERAAVELGQQLVKNKIELVYGGGNVGLMGAIADEVLNLGGRVTGVIPEFLQEKEVGHTGLSELIVVDSMHQRKQKMAELADAFIAMPGGLGTLEELAEISTWVQLELIKKPIGLLNINNFWQPLKEQLDRMVQEGFVKQPNLDNLVYEKEPSKLLQRIKEHKFSDYSIWQDLDKT